MIVFVLIALLAAFCEASVVVKVDFIKTETEHFDYVCPVTGYKVSGYSWSTCQDGKTRVVGCVSTTGERYRFGERFTDAWAEWECRSEGDMVILEPIACIVQGRKLQVGESMLHDKFYLQCKKAEDKGLLLDVIGCSDRDQEFVPINSTFVKGKFQYFCDESETEVYEKIIACIVDDIYVGMGDKVQIGDYIVQCQRKGQKKAKIDVIGCADDRGQLLDDGDTITRGTVVYQCKEKDESFALEAIGCYAKDFRMDQLTEFLFGETWYDTYSDTIKLKMECTHKGQLVGPAIIGCQFNIEGDIHELRVGCGREVGKMVLTCQKHGLTSVKATRKKLGKSGTVEEIIRLAQVDLC